MARAPLLAVIAIVAMAVVGIHELRGSVAVEPRSGDFVTTSAQLPVKLTVAEDARTLTFDLRWRCQVDRGVLTFRTGSVRIADDGSFSWRGRHAVDTGDSDQTRQRLRFQGRREADGTLTGTWSASVAYYNGQADVDEHECAGGEMQFRARRRGPANTDPGGNLVIALDGEAPYRVALGAGATWALSGLTRPTLIKIDPATGRIATRTALGQYHPILGAGEGAAWLVTDDYGFHLARVDARTGRVRRVTVDPPRRTPYVYFEPILQALAVGAGGVWLLDHDRVLRLDPKRGGLVRTIRLPRATGGCVRDADAPNDDERLAVGAGAVWVISRCSLSRIDPRSDRVTRTVALRQGFSVFAVDARGVWAATGQPRVAVHRIDPRDGRSLAVTPLPGVSEVAGVALSRDAVWIAQNGDRSDGSPNGALLRLDRTTGHLSTALELEDSEDVVVGAGAVWVVDAMARTLTRVRR